MKAVKILAVGNSYSNNTTRYISKIVDSSKTDTKIFAASLYFPGATLAQHVKNINAWNSLLENHSVEETREIYYSDKVSAGSKYECLYVGATQMPIISLYEAIRYEDWDYITVQQSPDGCDDFSSYWTVEEPYLTQVCDLIEAEYNREDMKNKKCPPIFVHQTWSFNCDMSRDNAYPNYPVAYESSTEMFKKIEEANLLAAKKIEETRGYAPIIIKSGEAVQLAQDEYGYSRKASPNLADNTIYNDYISHLNARGCYLAACVWIETFAQLTGAKIDISTSSFLPPVEGATLEDCQKLQNIARKVVKKQ